MAASSSRVDMHPTAPTHLSTGKPKQYACHSKWIRRPDRTDRNNDTPVDVPSNTNFATTPCGVDMPMALRHLRHQLALPRHAVEIMTRPGRDPDKTLASEKPRIKRAVKASPHSRRRAADTDR
jgi:hypothetical protein